jgi:hypothetical protein
MTATLPMTNATSNTEQQVRITYQFQTTNGNPAPFVGEPALTPIEGDGTASVENADAAAGKFEVVIKSGAANVVTRVKASVSGDLDGSGDAPVEDEIVYVVTLTEGSALNNATVTVEARA